MEPTELNISHNDLLQEIDKLNDKIANMESLLEDISKNLSNNNKNNSTSLSDNKHADDIKLWTDIVGKMLIIWSGEELIVKGSLGAVNLIGSLFGFSQIEMNPLAKPIVKTILTLAMTAYGHENIAKDFIIASRDTVIDIGFQVKKDIFDPIYDDLSSYDNIGDFLSESYDIIYDHTITPVGDFYSDLISYIY